MDPNTAIRLTASSFSSSTPFTPEACTWVTDEIAVALGISQGRSGGDPLAGSPLGGTPPGFSPIGDQGMPTQMAPGAPGGYQGPAPTPGQGFAQGQQGQGFGSAPGQQAQGFGAGPGQPGPQDQPTAQGYRPGYEPQPQQPGGFGQVPPPVQGYPGQPTATPGGPGYPGQPGGFPAQGQGPGYPGQATFGQPGGPGYPGQPGYPQGGQQVAPGGWSPGGGFGPGGPAPYSPVKTGGGKRGLLIGGGVVVGIIVIIIIAIGLSGGNGPKKPIADHSSTPTTQPSNTPTTTPSTAPAPTGGIEPLKTIMNPAGLTPVGTSCSAALYFGLNKSTITSHIFCAKTTVKNIDVWGYQFDSAADYRTGLKHINSFTGFKQTSTSCPPASGSNAGSTGWHANSNPRYKARDGQDLECFVDNGKPLLIWTMPTQDVFFIAQDRDKTSAIPTIVSWWKTVNYG